MSRENSERTILVVESTRFMLRVLRYGLEKCGYSVCSVPDGEAALMHIRANAPDVLVVDSGIRPMSGDELCRRIQTEMPERSFFTCVLTASAEDEQSSFGQWFSQFVMLEKPVSMRKLIGHIEHHFAEPVT